MWKSFPRDLEQRLNHLLDEALPTPAKAFQLFKSCQSENLWNQTFEIFTTRLNEFCAVPRIERRKSQFDRWLDRPLDHATYASFYLTFRSVEIEPTSVRNIASWAHHLMRFNLKIDEKAISISTIEKTLGRLINPTATEKDSDIEFSDFCEAWKKVVGPSLNSQQQKELELRLQDLKTLDQHSRQLENSVTDTILIDTTRVYLTQTEIDWAYQVRRSAFAYGKMPKYPLRRGPDKKHLVDLEKMVALYDLIYLAEQEELIKHRESIRLTILDRCDFLLKDKAVA